MTNISVLTNQTFACPLGEELIARNVDRLVNTLLGGIVESICSTSLVQIRQVTTAAEYELVKASRLHMYSQRGSYFDKLIEEDGSDRYDAHSYIFAAYYEGSVVGSIRLTSYPFEVCQYVEPATLDTFLGKNYESKFLELSRLVVDKDLPIKRVSRALIVYSGLLTSLLTNFDRYLAIARPEVKRKSFDFKFVPDVLPFVIKERGEHQYELVKGSFISDFYEIMSSNLQTVSDVLTNKGGGGGECHQF